MRWGSLIVAMCLAPACAPAPEPSSTGSASTSSTTTTDGGETTTESDSGEIDEGGETMSFVAPNDAGPVWCDMFGSPDCPEGEKCNPYATMGSTWDANGCFPIMGDGQAGEPCMGFGDGPGTSGIDDCAPGLMCWEISQDDGFGWCIEHCYGEFQDPQCSTGVTCAIYGSAIPALCYPTCDPLIGAADCPGDPEKVCLPIQDGPFACVIGTEGSAHGEPCTYFNECAPGLLCLDPEVVADCVGLNGCCTELCDLDAPNCPDEGMGMVCTPWYEPGQEPPGYEHIGVCRLP